MAHSTLIVAGFALRLVVAQNCDCYLTNGSTPSYFTSHLFQDFRTLPRSYTSAPAAITSENLTTTADVTSSYFTLDAWTNTWQTQSWNNSDSLGTDGSDASVVMINSQNNVYIENADDPTDTYQTHLTMRTTRLSSFQSAAEIDSVAQNYHYVSLRLLARVIGSPGACAGIFTYLSTAASANSKGPSSQSVQEADIEILTSGPRNVVQLTNQPSVDNSGNALVQATSNSTLPDNLDWSEWNIYRLDWTPGKSEWYINGVKTTEITFQAPRDPSGLILNMWSDGGSWTGNMSVNDYAYLQVQWMEVVYNTSGPVGGIGYNGKRDLKLRADKDKGCQVVCSVDDGSGSGAGNAVVVANNTGAASSLYGTEKGSFTGSMVYGLVLGILGVWLL